MPLALPQPSATSSAVRASPASYLHLPAGINTHHSINHASCCALNPIGYPGGHRQIDSDRQVSCRCIDVGTAVDAGWKDEDFVEVGTLGRPHGIQGEVVVSIDTSFPEERFSNPGVRYAAI